MLFKGALDKIKRFLPKLKKVSKKRLLIFAIPIVLVFIFLSYEGFIYARTLSFVGKGDDYFKVGKYTEALTEYREAADIWWSHYNLLHHVISSPTASRIPRTEEQISASSKAALKSFTPEIKIVSWKVWNIDCSSSGNCRKISDGRPSLIPAVYAACNSIVCSEQATILTSTIKNKSNFPAYYVSSQLIYEKNGKVLATYDVMGPGDLTYIPAKGTVTFQRAFPIAPEGTRPKLVAEGVTYYENDKYYSKLHELRVLSFTLFYNPNSHDSHSSWGFRLKVKNTSNKTLDHLGVDAVFKANGTSQSPNNPSITVPYAAVFYSPDDGYFVREVVDKSKPGRPVVSKPIAVRSGETITLEGPVEFGTKLGGLNKILQIYMLGFEKD